MRLLVALLMILVVAGGAVAGRSAWQDGRLNPIICDGSCGPSNVIAPPGLRAGGPAPTATSPQPALSAIDPEAVVAAVDAQLSDGVLGPHVGFAAAAPAGTSPVAAVGDGAFTPASTTKLLTGFAALATIDPQKRFETSVVDAGERIVLVGGGDPYLTATRGKGSMRVERAELKTLAEKTATALKDAGRTSVRLGFDDTLFSGPSISPTWEDDYVPGNVVTPVAALWVDQGVTDGIRSSNPAQSAADRFADLLGDAGVKVTGDVAGTAAPQDAATLATVRSATAAQIVEALVRTSDNEAAEVMLRQTAIAAERPATFVGGAQSVTAALKAAGVDTAGLRLYDGSGLSRRNLISPTTLVDVVRASLATSRGAAVIDDLPVSGFSGTLATRFDRATRGLVRAKTGTLTGVHSLAGYAVDADGRPVVFAVMTDDADQMKSLAAQSAVDDVATAVARCSCG